MKRTEWFYTWLIRMVLKSGPTLLNIFLGELENSVENGGTIT
jgi:hypothetical protein